MAESIVSICNMSFDHLGSDIIEALYPVEKTPNSKRAKRWFDISRRAVLEGFDWNFARRQKLLNLSSDDAPADWQYRYDWPADCVAPRRIWNPLGENAPAIPYTQLMGSNGVTRTILTNMPEAELVYSFDQTAVELFPASFTTLLSYMLAANMGYAITRKQGVRDEMLKAYWNSARFIPGTDANQQVPKNERDADWITGR
jgi:hypothetical protein